MKTDSLKNSDRQGTRGVHPLWAYEASPLQPSDFSPEHDDESRWLVDLRQNPY